MEAEISNLIREYQSGLAGEGSILWHKKLHKNGSGEFACVLGMQRDCPNVIGCDNCYTDHTGGYCMDRHGESVNGFLAVEQKHSRFVEEGIPGAYSSIQNALNFLSKNNF